MQALSTCFGWRPGLSNTYKGEPVGPVFWSGRYPRKALALSSIKMNETMSFLNSTGTTVDHVGLETAEILALGFATSTHGIQYVLSRVVFLCIAVYAGWQYLLRTGALWNSKSEPPMLPYLIPGVGHSVAFLRNTHKTLVEAQ